MKMSGVVRRIDNLGRIVIPKEIRKTLRIQNGDNLAIFMDENDSIVLRKFSHIDRLKEISKTITETLTTKNESAFVTSNDLFVAGSGKYKKDLLDKQISNDLLKKISERKTILNNNGHINLTNDFNFHGAYLICPIIASGDALGLIVILSDNKIEESSLSVVKIISNFLAKHIEE